MASRIYHTGMKVKDLIKELNECDPDQEVFFEDVQCDPYECTMVRKGDLKQPILTIERPLLDPEDQEWGA